MKPQKAGQKVVNNISAREQCCEISQVANFRNPAKFLLLFSILNFCSKSPLIRSCIFEFGTGSSCLNWIEDNEVFGLQNY